jgi:hypothetical protein
MSMTDASSGFDLATQYPGYVGRLFQIESGGDPNAVTGSNRGLGQFGPSEEARYGITDANRGSYDAQAAAVAREAAEHAAVLQRALGRPPTAGELYLTHQQGVAGGPALLTASDNQPAWMAIRPYYRSDAIAKQAISGNIPSSHPLYRSDVNQITVGDFRNLWTSKFEGGGAPAAVARASFGPGTATSVPMGAPAPAGLSAMAGGGADVSGGSLTQDQTAGLAQAQKFLGDSDPSTSAQGQLQPAPPLQQSVNVARLRNAIAGRQGGISGLPLPPSVKQRIAALMGRMGE